jgi:hypothetical protein
MRRRDRLGRRDDAGPGGPAGADIVWIEDESVANDPFSDESTQIRMLT